MSFLYIFRAEQFKSGKFDLHVKLTEKTQNILEKYLLINFFFIA